jgi:cytochrome oxidase Cu insertion factor (SCO1/SenC/PrrC family)
MLIGVALLFFAPLALAFYLYYAHGAWRPIGRVNAGELIEPPRPLPPLALPLAASGLTQPAFLRHKWTLVIWADGSCDDRCRETLHETRQVRLALDRDMDRVQRVFMAGGECCDLGFLDAQHPDLITIRVTAAAAPWMQLFPRLADHGSGPTARVYVIDPLGNLMMSYAPGATPKGMLEDLKRLLRLSHIG